MIIIVDFGSQTCHLIHRRLRDLGVENLIVHPEDFFEVCKVDNNGLKLTSTNQEVNGVILSGGPASVYENGAPTIDKKVFETGVPILGICYGWQLTAYLLKGDVRGGKKEYGPAILQSIKEENKLLENIPQTSKVWMSHGDSVYSLPEDFEVIASTDDLDYAFVGNEQKKIFGVQFHPEVDHTEYGNKMLENFANLCGLQTAYHKINPDDIITKIKEKVGDKKVICAVSGGVDSSVAATLIGRAIGNNLFPVYVESGLMRKGTGDWVHKTFKEVLGIEPVIVQAKEEFLNKLKGVIDPEEKRKIIGKLYVDIFDREAAKLFEKFGKIDYLAQGTIYSDVIESKGTKNAAKIKSHHNVGGLPEDMEFELLEPLREYYKDEVRWIGSEIGLSDEIVNQQVFPGPGYAVRIMGEVTAERLEPIYEADAIVIEELKKAELYDKLYMSFVIMTGAYSTAVKGDARQYMEVVALRIIESKDVMTCNWAHIDYDVLARISSRIVNEVDGVSRVVYDITNKPPATMEWE